MATENEQLKAIEESILEVANLSSKLTYSDLQGVAIAKAKEIFDLLKAN